MYIEHAASTTTTIASLDLCVHLFTVGARLYLRSLVPGSAKFYVAPERTMRCLECMVGLAVKRVTTSVSQCSVEYTIDHHAELYRVMTNLGSKKLTQMARKLDRLPIYLLHPGEKADTREMVTALKNVAEELVAEAREKLADLQRPVSSGAIRYAGCCRCDNH